MPGLMHINATAKHENRKALVTIPGLGCGMFSGQFHGSVGKLLEQVLVDLIKNYCSYFTHIKAVYYDPFRECGNNRVEIGDISFLTRPLTMGNENKPQLCAPRVYEEANDDFQDCKLFSFVAWDHVSWPGNDFYLGSRVTDDGVKSAATNSMAVMTGVAGHYCNNENVYEPPKEYVNWWNVVFKNKIELNAKNNLIVIKP